MDILDTQPTISKWEQLSDGKEFRTPYSAAEKQTLRLLPFHEKFKTIFEITGIYYVSCEYTDFILDAEVKSVVQLDSKGITPTANELYEVYLKTRLL